LKDEHEAVRAAAAHALGVLGSSEAIRPLVEALQDATWLVRAAAVQALGMLGELAPVKPLMLALNDEDESVRAVAIRVSGTMGERVPLERLLAALQDSAWQVREIAVLALGARGGPIPRSALTLALQDEDESVRRAANFLQEMYPDRFAETAAVMPASVSEERGEPAVNPFVQASLQHYPRTGALRVLRVALLVCWSIFLGYVVSITWNLVQLTHADQTQLNVRFVEQALSAPLTALAGLNIPAWVLSICMLLALLLFFGCLWATRDTWKDYKWKRRLGVHGEELEAASEDHNQFTRAPLNPPQQIPATHLLSRRAALVGLTTVLIVGNGIAWSLLISSKRKQGSSHLGSGRVLYIYRGLKGRVRSVAWSPHGTHIASGSDDKTMQVWEAANGAHSFTIAGLASTVSAVAWSPDGTRIASGGESAGTVQVWDATGRNISTFQTPSDTSVTALAWSPEGGRIASANGKGGLGQAVDNPSLMVSDSASLQVWDIANRGHSYSVVSNQASDLFAVVWSSDGKYISSVDDTGAIQVLDVSTRQSTFPFGPSRLSSDAGTFTVAAYSLDGKHIAMARVNKMVEVWDSSSGKLVYTYRGHSSATLGLISALAWSPDGKRIASGSADKTVHVWDAFNGENVYIYHGHSDKVTALAWSPDGKYIASGSDDKTVQVWSAG
jgi:WD40 repeat protein